MREQAQPTTEVWSRAHAVTMLVSAVVSLASASALTSACVGVCSLFVLVLLHRGRFTPAGSFGAANAVTLLRVSLTASVALFAQARPGPAVALLVLSIFALDGIDGWLARRNAQASTFGAVFDMECDALLVLLCGLVLYLHGLLAAFILLPGLLRYAYVLVLPLLPRSSEAPRSRFARYAFGLMVISLSASLWPLEPLHRPLALFSTLLIVYSFARSVYWSFRPV